MKAVRRGQSKTKSKPAAVMCVAQSANRLSLRARHLTKAPQ